jgi:hypothetical protein
LIQVLNRVRVYYNLMDKRWPRLSERPEHQLIECFATRPNPLVSAERTHAQILAK